MKEEEKEVQAGCEWGSWTDQASVLVPGPYPLFLLGTSLLPSSLKWERSLSLLVYKSQRVYVKIGVDWGPSSWGWSAGTWAGLYPGNANVSCPFLLADQRSRCHWRGSCLLPGTLRHAVIHSFGSGWLSSTCQPPQSVFFSTGGLALQIPLMSRVWDPSSNHPQSSWLALHVNAPSRAKAMSQTPQVGM